MKKVYSSKDCNGRLWVDCTECQRGWNGDRTCSAGWHHDQPMRGGCFCGIVLPDAEPDFAGKKRHTPAVGGTHA